MMERKMETIGIIGFIRVIMGCGTTGDERKTASEAKERPDHKIRNGACAMATRSQFWRQIWRDLGSDMVRTIWA